ncbi:hypothetical protein [Oligoflexus tunisiensis]|uniref:hypothetical protein n=1 Tax=Oligoflexus tunisiensis TaxID=708132 RepID=UPI00114C9D35|nr:hypothetical protein [Oligoflexus tunisiensis]
MKSFLGKVLLLVGAAVAILAVAFVIFIKVFTEPSDRDENGKPPRAAGIPADHEWYGGLDGGTWIHCDPQNDLKEFHCSIYGESGSLFGRGLYIPSRPVVPPYEFKMGGERSIDLKDQQGEDLVLKAEGWIETLQGKLLYKNGEPVDNP